MSEGLPTLLGTPCPSCKQAYGDECEDSSGMTVPTHISRKRKFKLALQAINQK